MFSIPLRRAPPSPLRVLNIKKTISRRIATLPSNPHIYVFPHKQHHILTLLPTNPPTPSLSICTTTALPPTPTSCVENPRFNQLLDAVLAAHAVDDPWIQGEAGAFATSGGGRGGWIHVSDQRAPPDYGRIAWPEDIFGSLEVDGRGAFVEGEGGKGKGKGGHWMRSGTYRVVTREGILGLSDFLRGKLVERLLEEEAKLEK